MSHSQNDEEEVIARFFGDTVGRFLDIGAHNGVALSNTRRLAELGWGGTCVEPSPVPFSKLMATYRDRADVNLVNAAIVPGQSPRIIEFSDSNGDFISTLDEVHRRMWAAPGADGRRGVDYQSIFVAGFPMASLVTRFPGPYHLVSIDVEGVNYQLFSELPLVELGVELACIEYQDRYRDIVTSAAASGYVVLHRTSENVLLVARRSLLRRAVRW